MFGGIEGDFLPFAIQLRTDVGGCHDAEITSHLVCLGLIICNKYLEILLRDALSDCL